MTDSSFLFEAILFATLLVIVLAWMSIRFALRVRLIDYPSSAPHKQHTTPTPLAGGIALLLTLALASLLLNTVQNPEVLAIFAGAVIVFLFGLLDDFRASRPLVKLVGQVLATVLLIRLGVSIQVFESPQFFIKTSGALALYLDWLLTILWVVGVTNAFNFVDSMDGLAVGLGGVAAAFFMLLALDAAQPFLAIQSALLLGCSIGLYFFNTSPAMLFLGDAGAQTIGFFLAALAIAYLPQGANQSSSYIVPIMVLGVPVFDFVLVVTSRLRRRLPIYAAARDHTYHRLLYLGIPAGRAVLVMQGASLCLGCLAFVILSQPPLIANVAFLLVLVGALIILSTLDQRRLWENPFHLPVRGENKPEERRHSVAG